MIQIYEEFKTNKHYNRMPRIFLPNELVNSLGSPSHRMLLYIQSNIKCGKTYEESQTILLDYKYFKENNILGKNSFYKSISELIGHKILFDSNIKNAYFVNYYYINAMSSLQYKELQQDYNNNMTNKAIENMTISNDDIPIDFVTADLIGD